MATFGDFPGVRVSTQSGGITSIAIGEEEKLVLFGEPLYEFDGSGNLVVSGDDPALSADLASPEQINARREAQSKFGTDSELALAMSDALANGANIDFLFGVAVPRTVVESEVRSTQTGTLDNEELVESTGVAATVGSVNDFGISVTDTEEGELDVELRYDGSPATPTETDTVFVNPLTGEYAVDDAPSGDYEFSYTTNEYNTAFSAKSVRNVVNENETGIYASLSDSDSAAADLAAEVSTLRNDFQLVNALAIAEPNDSEVLGDSETSVENGGADARYDTANYGTANQSVSDEFLYKFAPGRKENVDTTITGGVGGLFAGNPITDPIYNDELSGFQSLEQKLSKTDSDNLRENDIIPIRTGGSVRVVGNRATNFSSTDSVAADFFSRRITDRVILIGKQVGDRILGRINDQETRDAATRIIRSQLLQLVNDGLIRPNSGDEANFSIDVFESSANKNEVKIDISFTPFGIVKRVDETITVDTN